MIFAQEPDLNQIHMMKDCGNHTIGHELVPIVTMPDQVMPEVLDNLPPQQQTFMQPPMMQSAMLTGVYTLAEEPELEVEENTVM